MPRDLENLRRWKQANRAKINAQTHESYLRHKAKRNAKRNERYALHADEERQYQRDKRAANPEAAKEYQQHWAATNPEKVQAKSKRWYDTHQEQAIAKTTAWQKANPERAKRNKAASDQRHKAERRAYIAAWHAANPTYESARRDRRRARISGATRNDVTPEQRQLVLAAAKGRCVYCPHYNPTCKLCAQGTHKQLTVDHITPIALGGDNTLHNLIACCRSCNSKKHANPTPIMVQPLLL